MYFLPGDKYLSLMGVKNCTMVELCLGRGLISTFGVDVFRGFRRGGGQKLNFLDNCLRRSFGERHIQLSAHA